MNTLLGLRDVVLSGDARRAIQRGSPPGAVEVMQPVSMERRDPGGGWLFEPLLDGIRCLAIYKGGSLRLLENGTTPLAARYPVLETELVEAGPTCFALDGEILVVDPRFEEGLVLPEEERVVDDGRIREREYRFLAFDLLFAAQADLRGVVLTERPRPFSIFGDAHVRARVFLAGRNCLQPSGPGGLAWRDRQARQ